MIDPTSLPIILKSLDFLFGEAQKILEERRKRRETKDIEVTSKNYSINASISQKIVPESISSIEEAVSTKISENLLNGEVPEVEHLLRLKDSYIKRYQIAKEKLSIYGTLDAPNKLIHEIEEAEDGIEEVANKLQSALSRIYNKKIVTPN